MLRLEEDRPFLLAHITPCDTSIIEDGELVWPDAASQVVTYSDMQTSIIVDLAAVECGVGRVRFGIVEPKWGVIDRSGEGARTTFTDEGWEDDDEM